MLLPIRLVTVSRALVPGGEEVPELFRRLEPTRCDVTLQTILGRCPQPGTQRQAFTPRLLAEAVAIAVGDHQLHPGHCLTIYIVILPLANHDNNQHAENENIRLGNLWDAMRIYGSVLAGFGAR